MLRGITFLVGGMPLAKAADRHHNGPCTFSFGGGSSGWGSYQPCDHFGSSKKRLVRRHLPIRLAAMLKAEELPAGVADLHAALAAKRGGGGSSLTGTMAMTMTLMAMIRIEI